MRGLRRGLRPEAQRCALLRRALPLAGAPAEVGAQGGAAMRLPGMAETAARLAFALAPAVLLGLGFWLAAWLILRSLVAW